MDEEKSILPWIIFLSLLALVTLVVLWLFGSTPGDRLAATGHPLAGKWRSGSIWTLIIYEDRWAVANGFKCRWEPAEGSAIRIELHFDKDSPTRPPVGVMADFRLHPESGGRQAVLNLMGQDLIFERMADGGPDGAEVRP